MKKIVTLLSLVALGLQAETIIPAPSIASGAVSQSYIIGDFDGDGSDDVFSITSDAIGIYSYKKSQYLMEFSINSTSTPPSSANLDGISSTKEVLYQNRIFVYGENTRIKKKSK